MSDSEDVHRVVRWRLLRPQRATSSETLPPTAAGRAGPRHETDLTVGEWFMIEPGSKGAKGVMSEFQQALFSARKALRLSWGWRLLARLRGLRRQRLPRLHAKELPPHLLRDIGLFDYDRPKKS